MTFAVRTISVEPGGSLPYREEEWREALVVVDRGELMLEMKCGRSCFFQKGDLLWLQGLPLATLHNRGDEPTVLVSTARDRGVR